MMGSEWMQEAHSAGARLVREECEALVLALSGHPGASGGALVASRTGSVTEGCIGAALRRSARYFPAA